MDEMTSSRSVLWFLVVLGSGLSMSLLWLSVRVSSRRRVVRRGMVYRFMMRSLVVLWGGVVRCLMMLRGLVGWLVMLRHLFVLHNRL